MKQVLLVLVLGAAGCQRSEPPPAPVVKEKPAWQERGETMVGKLRVGMSQDAVLQLFGEPNRHSTMIQGGVATIVWEYELTTRAYVELKFDADQRLRMYKVTSPSGPQ